MECSSMLHQREPLTYLYYSSAVSCISSSSLRTLIQHNRTNTSHSSPRSLLVVIGWAHRPLLYECALLPSSPTFPRFQLNHQSSSKTSLFYSQTTSFLFRVFLSTRVPSSPSFTSIPQPPNRMAGGTRKRTTVETRGGLTHSRSQTQTHATRDGSLPPLLPPFLLDF